MFYGQKQLSCKSMIILSANTSWYLYNFRANTIKALLNQGHQVTCLSPHDDYTFRLKQLGCHWRPLEIDGMGLNIFNEIKLLFRLIKNFREIKPTVVLNFTIKNNIYGTLAAHLLKIPIINNISGLGTIFIRKDLKYRAIRFFYLRVLPLSTKIFCQNAEDIKLLKNLSGISGKQLQLIPGSGVDVNRFHPGLKNMNKKNKKKFRFLFSGRFLADKGIFELIEAAKKLNLLNIEYDLWLVGFQNNENISNINSSVINGWSRLPNVTIFESTHEIEKILSEVDCLVLPSYREGMPKSVLEACSMSLPVICTDVEGCNSVIEHSINGLLCKPKDAESLMETMKMMLSMPKNELEEMGDNGREVILKQFDERLVIKQTLDAINLIHEK